MHDDLITQIAQDVAVIRSKIEAIDARQAVHEVKLEELSQFRAWVKGMASVSLVSGVIALVTKLTGVNH